MSLATRDEEQILEAVVVMSTTEARECADEIRARLADIDDRIRSVRQLALHFWRREGWRALGYPTWEACMAAEFKQNRSQIFREVRAGLIEERILQALDTEDCEASYESPRGDSSAIGQIPEKHLRELGRLDEADQVPAWREVRETAPEGKVTTGHVARVVERIQEQQSLGQCADCPTQLQPGAYARYGVLKVCLPCSAARDARELTEARLRKEQQEQERLQRERQAEAEREAREAHQLHLYDCAADRVMNDAAITSRALAVIAFEWINEQPAYALRRAAETVGLDLPFDPDDYYEATDLADWLATLAPLTLVRFALLASDAESLAWFLEADAEPEGLSEAAAVAPPPRPILALPSGMPEDEIRNTDSALQRCPRCDAPYTTENPALAVGLEEVGKARRVVSVCERCATAAAEPITPQEALRAEVEELLCTRCQNPLPPNPCVGDECLELENGWTLDPRGCVATAQGARYCRGCREQVVACRVCGCTDEAACRTEGGASCTLIEDDLCSGCEGAAPDPEPEPVPVLEVLCAQCGQLTPKVVRPELASILCPPCYATLTAPPAASVPDSRSPAPGPLAAGDLIRWTEPIGAQLGLVLGPWREGEDGYRVLTIEPPLKLRKVWGWEHSVDGVLLQSAPELVTEPQWTAGQRVYSLTPIRDAGALRCGRLVANTESQAVYWLQEPLAAGIAWRCLVIAPGTTNAAIGAEVDLSIRELVAQPEWQFRDRPPVPGEPAVLAPVTAQKGDHAEWRDGEDLYRGTVFAVHSGGLTIDTRNPIVKRITVPANLDGLIITPVLDATPSA